MTRSCCFPALLAALASGFAFGGPLRAQAPPAASVAVKVEVPASMRTAPFDTDRSLLVPPRFTAAVLARVPGARFLAVAPNGDVLVSQPGAGKVEIVRPGLNGGDPRVSDFATGLRSPHDIVFHAVGGVTYVYISESNQINRYVYNTGDVTAHDRQIVVSGLPDASSPELRGAYGHQLKNIALDTNDKLYVSIGSATNADPADQAATPVRGAIYQYNADGTGGRLFARGLRNAEGLAFVPGTGDLWAAVNNRDQIAYPYNDATGLYGQVVTAYVDNHPPEEFTRVRDGGNYGWPFANPSPDTASGPNDMPFDPDFQNNKDGSLYAVGGFDRISKGIQAHSAPLGLLFLQDTAAPDAYKLGALVVLHGSWNRTVKTGYKIVFFPWNANTQTPGDQMDFVTGWLDDASQTAWGRPVDAAVTPQGDVLVSDDQSGTIYKLTYHANPVPAVSTLSPASAIAGGPALTLSVTGTGFVDGSTVLWNGTSLLTTFGSASALTATVPAPLVATAGGAGVSVVSPAPGGGVSGTLPFTVTAPPPPDAPVAVSALTISPTPVVGSAGATGTVTLNTPAPAGGATVSLFSDNSAIGVPASVGVAAGATTASFTVGTVPVASATVGTVTATLNGGSKIASLTVQPPVLFGLALAPASVVGGTTATGTLTISAPAPAGGLSVALAGSGPVAALPATVAVAAGSTTATFALGTTTVGAQTNATVTASLNGVSQATTLAVTPAAGTVFGAGLRLISLPFDCPGSPDALFGLSGVRMAVWSPATLQYAVTPTAPADAVRLGRGYWVRLPADAHTTALGTPADPSKDFEVVLERGWNQIGQPFPTSTTLSALQVRVGAQTLMFADAVGANAIAGTVYGYTPGAGYTALDTLAPGQGAWVYAFGPATLVFPHP